MAEFIELPQSAVGLYTFHRTANSHWGKEETITALLRIGHILGQQFSAFGVGHISKKDGSVFKPHASHRKGIDVDIRPLRKDGLPRPVTIYQAQYDREATCQLLELIRAQSKVKTILFNDPVLIKEGLCRKYAGHDNHLHVRFDY